MGDFGLDLGFPRPIANRVGNGTIEGDAGNDYLRGGNGPDYCDGAGGLDTSDGTCEILLNVP